MASASAGMKRVRDDEEATVGCNPNVRPHEDANDVDDASNGGRHAKRARPVDAGVEADGSPALDGRLRDEGGGDDGDDTDDQLAAAHQRRSRFRAVPASTCPYMFTINRSVLDFDFEKCCSVTLSPVNVYACLVCGRYFRGRGKSTPAYQHALETDHALFMRLP